mmetsp:Transcript_14087/g.32134  ORF Transcript_14087/g.32134 Transcript_14087/m.32134 type:complete len:204 (-) Transcript_14087:233-844(-)
MSSNFPKQCQRGCCQGHTTVENRKDEEEIGPAQELPSFLAHLHTQLPGGVHCGPRGIVKLPHNPQGHEGAERCLTGQKSSGPVGGFAANNEACNRGTQALSEDGAQCTCSQDPFPFTLAKPLVRKDGWGVHDEGRSYSCNTLAKKEDEEGEMSRQWAKSRISDTTNYTSEKLEPAGHRYNFCQARAAQKPRAEPGARHINCVA